MEAWGCKSQGLQEAAERSMKRANSLCRCKIAHELSGQIDRKLRIAIRIRRQSMRQTMTM